MGMRAKWRRSIHAGANRIVITGNSLFTLDGRVALITGASRGLGLAMAEGLAEVGAIVALNGRNVKTLEPVASAMRGRDQDRDEREQAQHRPILLETPIGIGVGGPCLNNAKMRVP